jgi:N utilization substance protein A
VPDYQLSLAIGKEGQNARLAARLTGLRVDIKSESQVRQEAEQVRQEAEQAEQAAVEAPAETEGETPATAANEETAAPAGAEAPATEEVPEGTGAN